jgi:hypothetical protein
MNLTKCRLLERIMFKLTSGRFIFTVVVAGVYAYLAINGTVERDFIREITLIVLYAYFSRSRPEDEKFLEGMEEDRKFLREKAERDAKADNGGPNA